MNYSTTRYNEVASSNIAAILTSLKSGRQDHLSSSLRSLPSWIVLRAFLLNCIKVPYSMKLFTLK